MLDDRELRELAAVLGGALAAVQHDVEQLQSMSIEVPAEMDVELRERDALVATMRWVCEQQLPGRRADIIERYRLERSRARRLVPGLHMPEQLGETKATVNDALGRLMSATTHDHALRRELFYAPMWPGWWWI